MLRKSFASSRTHSKSIPNVGALDFKSIYFCEKNLEGYQSDTFNLTLISCPRHPHHFLSLSPSY